MQEKKERQGDREGGRARERKNIERARKLETGSGEIKDRKIKRERGTEGWREREKEYRKSKRARDREWRDRRSEEKEVERGRETRRDGEREKAGSCMPLCISEISVSTAADPGRVLS